MSHFLFATVPIPAHSRIPLPIADRLVRRGHEVSWFAGSRFHDGIGALGATPVPFRTTRDVPVPAGDGQDTGLGAACRSSGVARRTTRRVHAPT
jgi:UDP:flavonoid glycosyltransferase YjiC (YdhE family)